MGEPSDSDFDYIIVGAGLGGLCTAALLARRGYRVCVLERHYKPGGYGHSFVKGGYTFCAQLHYLWNCGPGEDFGVFLRRLGLQDEIRFAPLDPWDKQRRFEGELRQFTIWNQALSEDAIQALYDSSPLR